MLKHGDQVEILRGVWKGYSGRIHEVIAEGERYGVIPKVPGGRAPFSVSLAASSIRLVAK